MINLSKGQWQVYRLEEIVVEQGIQTGPFGSQLHASDYVAAGVPVVMPKDMIDYRISADSIAKVSQKFADGLHRHKLKAGDLVFSRRGEIGRCALVTSKEEGWLCGTGSLRVRLSPQKALPTYVIQAMALPEAVDWLVANAVGQTMLNLSATALSQLPIMLPPLSEQRKIAEILSTWDAAIERVEQLIAALQRRKQGLMQRLLTGEVRFGEFAEQEWKEVELSHLVEPVVRPEQVRSEDEYRLIGVRWYLEGAHIHDVVPGSGLVSQSLSRIEEGDILYNKMWVSKAAFAVARSEHEGAYGTGEYPQFKAKAGLDVDFLAYAFHSPRFQHDATALCRGTTGRIRLHPRDFLKLTIILPSLPEQRRIAEVLAACDKELALHQQKLAALRRQKQGLMQRLLTGAVRVNSK